MLITFLASFLIWILFAGLFVLWFIDGRIKKEEAVHGLFSFTAAWLSAEVLKPVFQTVRPFLENGSSPLVIFPLSNGAFPSGHTAAAFALAITIFRHDKRAGWIYILGALAVGVARILANVHYPVDIVGGAILGMVVALLTERLHFFKLKA